MLWPQVRRPFSCTPPCAGARHSLVLDRPRAQQRLPVRTAGGVRERGRHRDAGRTAPAHQRAVQLGKAQVVADAEADAAAAPACERDGLRAGAQHARLVVALASVVVAEQVQLVVARGQRAVGRERAAGVVHARRLAVDRDRQRAADQPDTVRARASARKRWIGPSPGASAASSLSASRRPIRQKYSGSATSSRAGARRFARQPRRASRLRSYLRRRHHLQRSDLHRVASRHGVGAVAAAPGRPAAVRRCGARRVRPSGRPRAR